MRSIEVKERLTRISAKAFKTSTYTNHAYFLLSRGRQGCPVDTLSDGAGKELFLICDQMKLDGRAPRTLTIDGDPVWIATKSSDVLLHPSKSLNLVCEAHIEVTQRSIREFRYCEEAK